jgi:hypothetical protein
MQAYNNQNTKQKLENLKKRLNELDLEIVEEQKNSPKDN